MSNLQNKELCTAYITRGISPYPLPSLLCSRADQIQVMSSLKDSRPREALALISNKWAKCPGYQKVQAPTQQPSFPSMIIVGLVCRSLESRHTYRDISATDPWAVLLSHSDTTVLSSDPSSRPSAVQKIHAAQLPRTGQDPQVQQQSYIIWPQQSSYSDINRSYTASRVMLPQLLLTEWHMTAICLGKMILLGLQSEFFILEDCSNQSAW